MKSNKKEMNKEIIQEKTLEKEGLALDAQGVVRIGLGPQTMVWYPSGEFSLYKSLV